MSRLDGARSILGIKVTLPSEFPLKTFPVIKLEDKLLTTVRVPLQSPRLVF